MQRLKSSAANVKVELFLNADSLETLDDKKMIAHLSLRDKVVSNFTYFYVSVVQCCVIKLMIYFSLDFNWKINSSRKQYGILS